MLDAGNKKSCHRIDSSFYVRVMRPRPGSAVDSYSKIAGGDVSQIADTRVGPR
jgi:hypothetical protein